jgi:hypothetical protein
MPASQKSLNLNAIVREEFTANRNFQRSVDNSYESAQIKTSVTIKKKYLVP